ncbi:MAG: FAD-binding domain-containing protein, partial [Bdellovibrionales bacterium]|nr:FAD-binding domain-containing protein [Bdellovibrionales bacterium]
LFSIQWKDVMGKSFPWRDSLESFITTNNKSVSIEIPPAGSVVAFERLKDFKSKTEGYDDNRNFPALSGTSKFSLFLKNGSLVTSQIIPYLQLEDLTFAQKSGPTQFLKELVWREFYYSILWYRPDVEKTSFLEKYKDIKWSNNKSHFARWCEGTTGYPIVDAGMRELNTTGWMHNRVRMIVASFLVKDLLINWQWGENYFMKMLLDGDLAPNNGGWQWASSTGCDPQPYFRIFNPWLQSEKFDPEGEYIRKYIPELASAPTKILHDPDGDRSRWKYPAPIVVHADQKEKALALYR